MLRLYEKDYKTTRNNIVETTPPIGQLCNFSTFINLAGRKCLNAGRFQNTLEKCGNVWFVNIEQLPDYLDCQVLASEHQYPHLPGPHHQASRIKRKSLYKILLTRFQESVTVDKLIKELRPKPGKKII